MSARTIGLAVASLAVAVSLTACNHGGSSSDAGDAKAKAKAVASSSANVAAEDKVKKEVTDCVNKTPTVKLLTSRGRTQVITCVKGLVPADKQDQLKDCLVKTAAAEKAYTRKGWHDFVNAGAAGCVMKATAPATPTPTPSGKKGEKKDKK